MDGSVRCLTPATPAFKLLHNNVPATPTDIGIREDDGVTIFITQIPVILARVPVCEGIHFSMHSQPMSAAQFVVRKICGVHGPNRHIAHGGWVVIGNVGI